MKFLFLLFLLLNYKISNAVRFESMPTAESKHNEQIKAGSIIPPSKKNAERQKQKQSLELSTDPVNNNSVLPPFPVGKSKNETVWDIKLKEYIYSYQIRYGNIGDKFVLPEDMDAFLETLPHGTDDKPILDPEKQDRITLAFDNEYEQNIVDQYYKMQYRVLGPTIK